MLSYMVPSPIEDKPPVAPIVSSKNTLRLVLENHVNRNGISNVTMASIPNGNASTHKKIIKNSSMTSAESSNSSLNSSTDIPSVHGSTPSVEKSKAKMTNGSVKQTTLKRVSFGSSKGSMVETLIYETPVQEEPEPTPSQKSNSDKSDDTDSYSTCEGVKVPSSKVRVSFFESTEKKYVLSTPDNLTNSEDLVIYEQLIMSSPSQMNNTTVHSYGRQESTDSGWDNPFRPDGDLSKEADEIVELIKEGKPITPTQNNPSSKLLHDAHDGNATLSDKQNLASSPKGSKVNGSAKLENSVVTGVEVQHVTTATPTDGTQVEHVVIKKKPKCKCCVVQ